MAHAHGRTTTALEDFIETIEATGGVILHTNAVYSPKGDPGWIDLAEAYVKACKELGREVMFEESDEPYGDEGDNYDE